MRGRRRNSQSQPTIDAATSATPSASAAEPGRLGAQPRDDAATPAPIVIDERGQSPH